MRTVLLSVLSLSIDLIPFLLVLLLLLGWMQKRFGAGSVRLVWVAVLLRLMIPVSLTGTSLMTHNVFAPILYDGTITAFPAELLDTMALIDWLTILWLAVTAGLLLFRAVEYALFCRQIRRWSSAPNSALYLQLMETVREAWALPRSVQLRICPKLKTPVVTGLLRPVILLPAETYGADEVLLMLHHEAAHLRRGDLLLKWAAMTVQCFYWFHPLLYILQGRMAQNLELACDEAVLRKVGRDKELQRAYSYLILATASGRTERLSAMATCLQDTRAHLKKRIDFIFDTNPRWPGLPVLALSAFVLVMSSGLLQLEYYDTRSVELLPLMPYETLMAVDGEVVEQSVVTIDLYQLERQLEEQEA